MFLHWVPFQKEIEALTKDEEFQKIFAEDKILDQAKTDDERDRRVCELVIDYLISKGKLRKFFREFWVNALINPK